ncbi:MAG: glycosyltransferase family 2 protein [Pseudomonadota bacterium]
MSNISLVVSTLGRTAQLARLLRSLEQQSYKNFEVIIVDQNADDRLKPVLEQHMSSLDIVATQSARGLSLGRNTGIELARGRILAFPDDDCWYPPNLLDDVVQAFAEEPKLDLLSGRTVDAALETSLSPFHKTARPIGRRNVWRSGNSNTIFVRARSDGALMFDENLGIGAATIFQSGEETDLLLRLIAAGSYLRFDPIIIVHHEQIDMRTDDALGRARKYAPGLGRVLRLHGFGPAAFWFALRPVVRASLAALTGDMAQAHYKLAWAKGLATGYLAPAPRR